ncbi:hypothetical protein [Seinonella peptonophila]|nr:hypothetical protein [Seinonella peptonophila]
MNRRERNDMMKNRYIPKINEAAIPENGGWAEIMDEPVLVLSIPEWESIMNQSTEEYQSVWMYDRIEDAYIFCFKLNEQVERAIAFAKDHAGVLLKDERAEGEFSILITHEGLEDADEETPCLYFKELHLRRHPKAGW